MTNSTEDTVMTNPPIETAGFTFNHTMVRVKDPKIALDFYHTVLGMSLLRKVDFPEMKFTLYFLACLKSGDSISDDEDTRRVDTLSREGVLELTHNWGTESDPDFQYHNGNSEPQGFGHICFNVPDLDAATAWFDKHEVDFIKRPEDGKMKDLAFIKDPDGYWIEIVQADRMTFPSE